MYKNLIYKILLLPKTFKLILIIFLDISIIIACTYLGLAIRLDEFNLFNYSDKILINVHYFLIPLISYFLFAFFFKFYSLSFRYYNLGNDLLYVFPLLGITILILNIFFNEYFSYGSIIISIILISSIIIISRKLISKIFLILQNKSKINTLIICNSKNLHKIYEYLNLNDKILIKSLVLEDQEKTDFSKYRNFRIKNIKNISEICKKYKIKLIYSDKIYKNLEKKIFKRIKINILQTDDLYKLSDLDDKQQFVDEYFKSPNKIKSKQLNYYKNKIVLITGAGGSIGKNLFFEVLNLKPKKIILAEQDELKLFNLKKEYDNIKFNYKTQININFLLGNLSNDYFLKKIFLEEKNIDCVLHASAYKHVGLGEENILSFVKNNIFVTHNLAKISILQNVKKFIFISTDKAVNPKSVMGYTKSICEKILINLNKKYNLKNFLMFHLWSISTSLTCYRM